jgi:inhibitor of KinA
MDILPYGTKALLVNFPQRIDPVVNGQVHALDRILREAALPGIRFSTPAYASLLVGFEPELISFCQLREQLEAWMIKLNSNPSSGQRRWQVPVCFADSFAPDQGAVLAHTGLPHWKVFIELFTSLTLRVYMLGFLPGFPYVGVLPEELSCPRKATPRAGVPARSLGLAGRQAGIYPSASPGGWQLIGRTPVPLFLPQANPPFLFRAGDEVQFTAVGINKYEELERGFATGEQRWQDCLMSTAAD